MSNYKFAFGGRRVNVFYLVLKFFKLSYRASSYFDSIQVVIGLNTSKIKLARLSSGYLSQFKKNY